MAGAPKKPPTKTLRMRVSGRLYDYLSHLSRSTLLGASENDVAAYILTRELEKMRQSNYQERELNFSQQKGK